MKNFVIDDQLKELTAHHTVALPLACYETVIQNHVSGFIPLHWHDEFQFVHVIKGEGIFTINEEEVKIREGEGLFINSGCLHMARDPLGTGCAYLCLNVSPSFLLPTELYPVYVQPFAQATNIPYLRLDSANTWAENILQSLVAIQQLMKRQSPFYEIEISTHLISIWKRMIMNGIQLQYEQSEEVKNDRLKEMLSWIHVHYQEKIHLDDIARSGQLSRSECCRYFKRMLKKSPMSYVTDYRIQKSCLLLQQEDAQVTDVAYQVGFTSTSYFIEKFRNAMGMTPLVYKRRTKRRD